MTPCSVTSMLFGGECHGAKRQANAPASTGLSHVSSSRRAALGPSVPAAGFFIGTSQIPVWLSWLRYFSFLNYG